LSGAVHNQRLAKTVGSRVTGTNPVCAAFR
jgi:hypothetical protein